LLSLAKDRYKEQFLVLFPCTCITTRIGSSLLDLFTTSRSPTHGGLCQFKITLLAPLQRENQTLSSFRFPSLYLVLLYEFSS
jgi:hypothetical protein